jgi:hypothetical protein
MNQAAHLEVLVSAPDQLPRLLADAEEALIAESMDRAAGILITRHDPRRYTVALSTAVPYGETHEYSML